MRPARSCSATGNRRHRPWKPDSQARVGVLRLCRRSRRDSFPSALSIFPPAASPTPGPATRRTGRLTAPFDFRSSLFEDRRQLFEVRLIEIETSGERKERPRLVGGVGREGLEGAFEIGPQLYGRFIRGRRPGINEKFFQKLSAPAERNFFFGPDGVAFEGGQFERDEVGH